MVSCFSSSEMVSTLTSEGTSLSPALIAGVSFLVFCRVRDFFFFWPSTTVSDAESSLATPLSLRDLW